ncbi:MAG TPA: regulatory protein RecX [Albitalea sp.]|uniref:regulatory protein RecX n=1 Tax=Piscinibacter sp. TaxID=1903157 RepID=UPI002ED2E2A9
MATTLGQAQGDRSAGRRKSPLSLKARALALLAQRDHSELELRRKLLRHARSAASADEEETHDKSARDVDAVVAWLHANRYFSEERFVESRIHARASRYGNLRIRQELAQHGLSLPAPAAQALKDNELERATEVWRRKFGAPAADAAGRARQSRFLAQRGFSPEVISRVLRASRGNGEPAAPDID